MKIRIVDTCEPNTVTADRGSSPSKNRAKSPLPHYRDRPALLPESERIDPGTGPSTRSGTDAAEVVDKPGTNAWLASENSAQRIEWEQFWNVVIDLAIDQSTPHPD